MTDWKSEKQRRTAKQILKILSHSRTSKRGVVNKVKEIRETKEYQLYETESKIADTLEEMVERQEIPIGKSSEGSFFERKDRGVAY